MAKKRTANRGWRSRMKAHLQENPEVQAQVDAINLERYTNQLATVRASQVSIDAQISYLEGEIERLSASAPPEAVS